MGNSKKLSMPNAMYDYVLYYECAKKDWIDYNKRLQIKGDGSLMNAIKWDVTYSLHPNDSGGATKCGITASTWESFVKNNPNKGYNKDLNSMNRQGWVDVVNWFWDGYSCATQAANYACACLLFQMAWGGFKIANKLVDLLKTNSDIPDYKFITSGSSFRKIADATNAYNDPMKAFGIMRNSLLSYYFNISMPNNKNNVFRIGWFNRVAIPFTMYGLYADVSLNGGKGLGLKYESTLYDWDSAISKHMQNGLRGVVKLFDWGADPETIQNLMSDQSVYTPLDYTDSSSSSQSSGSYGGCGGVYQLGNYTNAPDMEIISQQTQSREDVLNTLVKGSYMPNDIKKCSELITSDKKKGNKKTKSEN